MATNTQTADGYNHEPIDDADLDGVTKTEAAKIAGHLDLTTVDAITRRDDGQIKVELEVDGGFTAFGNAESRYAIKSVVGRGNPETISVWIVEKRV